MSRIFVLFLFVLALGAKPALAGLSAFASEAEELDRCAPQEPAPFALGEVKWRLSSPFVSLDGDRLVADLPPERGRETAWAQAELDLSAHYGHCVRLTIRARGTGVGKPSVPHLGLKFMVTLADVWGGRRYPNVRHREGDWEEDLEVFCDLGGRVESCTLNLGLQEAPGRVEFDLSTLRAEDLGPLLPEVNRDYQVRYHDGGGAVPPVRHRGVMLPAHPERITEDDFATLEKWGANLVRYQMCRDWNVKGGWESNDDFDAYMDFALGVLETNVLPWAAAHGQKVVIDMHATPGARNATRENRMFYEERYARHFPVVWRRIAERFRGHPAIYGYDLVNEPMQVRPAPFSMMHVQLAAARAIREVDPDTPIIVAANGYGSPDGFKTLSPLAMDNVIYQPHCYVPGEFTHQGLRDRRRDGLLRYPDPERGWDREFIRRELAPVRDFQLRHGARIYVGEFSAISWAPGADQYLRDCIEIFEEYGWDWSYHAFREYDGWSVEKEWRGVKENGWDRFAPSDDNPRKRALLDGLRRNIQPPQ